MADKSLFTRLNKLFSNNVVVRRIGKNRIRVVDTDRLQSQGALTGNRYTDRFTRMHGTKASWSNFNQGYNYQTHGTRLQLYEDYETMDMDSIIAGALDIYSEDASVKDAHGDVLSIKSSDENIRKILHNLFYDILNIEFNLQSWTRNLCKYGDFFLYLDIQEDVGIVNVIPLSVYAIQRIEGEDPNNPHAVYFVYEADSKQKLENYEVAHFRLLSDANYLPYGKSMIEPARKVWKQLTLMEDAMLIHRIMRAPEKRIFKIDVGNIPPSEVDAHIQQIITEMKKVPFIDPASGEYNLKYNMMNILEDYYLPVRGGQSGTEVDTVKGLEYNAIDDVEYLRNRMLAALKVPKAFIGYEEAVEGKATLASQDVRFARTIERIQRIIVSELTKLAIVHLSAQGYEDADLVNFELSLTTPSIVFTQEKIQILQEQIQVAKAAQELYMFSDEYIYEEVFGLSIDEYQLEQLRVIENVKQKFRRSQIENEGNDPAKTGESYGTPHDLASMGQMRPGGSNFIDKDQGNWPIEPVEPKKKVGRPTEPGTYGKHKSNLTRDPLGTKQISTTFKPDENPLQHKYKNGSPLHTDNKLSDATKRLVDSLHKVKSKSVITESLKSDIPDKDASDKGTFMDESQLLDGNKE